MRSLANCVAFLHLYWIKTLVLGLVVAYFVEWYRSYQVVMVVVTLTSWPICNGCPCTVWEQHLRRKYDPDNFYQGGFVAHYSKKLFGFYVPETAVRISIATILAGSLAIYLGLLD